MERMCTRVTNANVSRRNINLRWHLTWSKADGSDGLHTCHEMSRTPGLCRWMAVLLLLPPHTHTHTHARVHRWLMLLLQSVRFLGQEK